MSYAAADCGLSVDEFKKRLARSTELSNRGLGLLLAENGSIKRDVWEQNFGTAVDELGIGEYLLPEHGRAERGIDPRTLVRIESQGRSTLANRVKSQVMLALNRSDDIRPVVSGGASVVNLSTYESGQQIRLSASLAGQTLQSEGEIDNLDDLAAKLADDIHIVLARRVVPPTTSNTGTIRSDGAFIGSTVPNSTQRLLDLALKTGSVSAAVSIDRGPGATYKMGEEIVVRFSANQDGFAALYDIDSAGTVSLLFPNGSAKNNHIQAGQIYSGDTWGLVANGTPGRERMFLMVAPSNAQLPGVTDFLANPSGGGYVIKSVGAFARKVQPGSTNSSSVGASLVEFFTSK